MRGFIEPSPFALFYVPFHGVDSVPAGEPIIRGQLTHTQLIRQAAVVCSMQMQATQEVPVKEAKHTHTHTQ